MNMKNLIKYGFIALVICFTTSCSEQVKKKVCLKIYMVNGRTKNVCYNLPINRSGLGVSSYRGTYELGYVDHRWWHRHWVVVKYGVVDYNVLHCR